jgi:hypothetical protein
MWVRMVGTAGGERFTRVVRPPAAEAGEHAPRLVRLK